MSMPRKLRCVVESITDHGGRVYTVDLAPANAVPSFRAGQFLHLTVDDFDPAGFWPESRVFSIANSQHDRSRIRICYSVKGRYTQKIEQTLAVGRDVWIKLPYGDFVIDDASDAVLIAGGTGISAFTAFVEGLTPEPRHKVTLVYGARTADLLLFQDTILDQFAKVARFNVIFFTENADAGFAGRMAALPRAPACIVGRISVDSVFSPRSSDIRCLISAAAPSPVYYLAGPPVMISVLSSALRDRGAEPDQIRVDAWE